MAQECDPLALSDTCSEGAESIIELEEEEEKCCLCGDKFYSRPELTNHLALHHFHHGLLQELLAQGWEDGDLRCPQCGDLGVGGAGPEAVLLHWATEHNRVEALVRRCYDGGRCSLYRDKLLCNDYLQRRSKPRIKILPNSKLARAFYQTEQEQDSQEEEEIIVLDGSDSSADEIEVIEEIEPSKSKHSSLESKTAAMNNNVNNLPPGPGQSIQTEGASDLSNNNEEAQRGDEEIIVETILERISSTSSEHREVPGKQPDLKVPRADQVSQVKSSRSRSVVMTDRSSQEVEPLVRATVCKICSKSFPSRREFQDHLAAQHFRLELEREIQVAGPGPASCPSCSQFRSKDLTGLIVHYGARCKPFPVNKLYSNWLSQSALGRSTDICVFCGARAHSPNDLVFHLIDKHVGDVLQKMYFKYFFKFPKVRDRQEVIDDIMYYYCCFQVRREQGEVVELSCPSCTRTEDDPSKLCLHFMRQHETAFIEVYQRFSRLGGSCVRCEVSGETFPSPHHHLHHLVSHHSQSLLSECGLSPDLMLACSLCPFVHQETEAMVSHYALEHHRLEFFFTESLTTLAEQGKIEVSHFNLQTESIGLDDFER